MNDDAWQISNMVWLILLLAGDVELRQSGFKAVENTQYLNSQMIKTTGMKKQPLSPALAYFQENSGPCFLQKGIPLDAACRISLLPWRSGSQNNSLRREEKKE